MFYSISKHFKKNSHNSNDTIRDYFAKVESPTTNRNGKNNKYYVEMQLMAFQLMRYLKMNNDPNEHSNQGNWNWTYFKENMADEDIQLLIEYINGEQYAGDKQAKLLEESDIGDTCLRIIYKPVNHDEIKRIVMKKNLKVAMDEIYSRVEIEYLRTEIVEYKED